jgi:Protein of unknown function (DUF2752)
MRRFYVLIAGAVMASGSAILYLFPPGPGSFYPPCPFYFLTGLYCPGCGSTRCLHSLAHGKLYQAAAYNVLLVLALPFLLAWGANCVFTFGKAHESAQTRPLPAWLIYSICVVLVAYWILRNVPYAPFDWLAPHSLDG